MGRDSIRIFHLQFADDTLLFCKEDDSMLNTMFNSIKAFEWLSGLKVNWNKSGLCGVNIESQRVRQIANKFNCKVELLPIIYLGLPLGGNPKSSDFWLPIQEKISKKLDRWKSFQLSRVDALSFNTWEHSFILSIIISTSIEDQQTA